jgi:hypothetical protein
MREMTITTTQSNKTAYGTLPAGTWRYWIEGNTLIFIGQTSVIRWNAKQSDGRDLIELVTGSVYFFK